MELTARSRAAAGGLDAGRRRLASLIIAASFAASCGGASPTASGTGVGSAAPTDRSVAATISGASASPTGSPTASAISSLGPLPTLPPLPPAGATLVPLSPGYTLLKLPLDKVRRVALPQGVMLHGIDSDGPRFVMDEIPVATRSSTQGKALIYVDLDQERCDILRTLDDGFLFTRPRIEGSYLVWAETRGSNVDYTGVMQYRVKLQNLDTGEVWQLETGITPNFPALSLDGGKLAVGITDENGLRTKLRVYDVRTRSVERSLYTDQTILAMAMSGGDVAYSEGKLEPVKNFLYDLHLMLWRPGQKPVELVKNANFLGFRDGRLAWVQDRPDFVGGKPQHSRIWTSLVSPFRPVPAAPPEEQGGESRQEWPNTGGGYVTWSSERLDIVDIASGGDHLSLWDPATGVAYELEPTAYAIATSARGGWLVWVQEGVVGPSVVYGIPLSELGLPK